MHLKNFKLIVCPVQCTFKLSIDSSDIGGFPSDMIYLKCPQNCIAKQLFLLIFFQITYAILNAVRYIFDFRFSGCAIYWIHRRMHFFANAQDLNFKCNCRHIVRQYSYILNEHSLFRNNIYLLTIRELQVDMEFS